MKTQGINSVAQQQLYMDKQAAQQQLYMDKIQNQLNTMIQLAKLQIKNNKTSNDTSKKLIKSTTSAESGTSTKIVTTAQKNLEAKKIPKQGKMISRKWDKQM